MMFLPIAIVLLLLGAFIENNFIIAVIILAIFLYTFMKYKEGLLLLFVYFPLRPTLIELNPSLKVVGDLMILALLLRVAFMYRREWKSLFRFQVFEVAFFIFLLIGAISAYVVSDVQVNAIIFQIRAFLLMYFVFYIVKRIEVTKEDLIRLCWTVLVMVLLIGLHGIIEKISLRTLLLPEAWVEMPLSSVNRIRIYGLLGNPNSLALFMSFSIIFLLYLREQISHRLIVNLVLLLSFSILVMTYSRGTWLAFIFSASLYVLISRKWKSAATVMVFTLLSIVLITMPVNYASEKMESTDFGTEQREVQKKYDQSDGKASDRITGTFDETTLEGSKTSGRLYIVKKGFEIFQDHPVIGTGFGTYGDSATLSYGSPVYEDYEISLRFYSDNQYIQIIVQTGTLGVILFALFLLSMLYYLIKNRKDLPNYPLLVSVLLGIFAISLVYNSWESYILTMFFYALLGSAVSGHQRSKKKLV